MGVGERASPAAGLGAALERSAVLFDAVRLVGAAYLVYLGAQAIRHRRELSTVLDVTATRPSRHLLREGFVVGVTVAIALVMDSCWGLAAGTARAWLSDRPHRLERLGGAGGLVIIGLGTRLALTGRKD